MSRHKQKKLRNKSKPTGSDAPKRVNIPSLLREAVALHQSGRFDEADALYHHILQVDPQHTDALHLSGLVMQQRGDLQAAVNLIQQAISGNANIALYHSSLGSICMDCGQWSDAQQCYQRSLQLAPGNSEAQDRLGFVLANQGEFEQAESCFREAIRLKPEYADAHFHRGLALGRLQRPEEAGQSFLVAVGLRPQWPEAWHNLGDAQKQQGQYEAAEKSYREEFRLQPSNIKACVSLGNVLKEQEDFTQALECYQQAIQMDPGCAEAYNNTGLIFYNQDKLGEAIQCYEKASSINPDYAEVCMNLGNAFTAGGQLDEAMDCFQQALKIDPDYAAAHWNYSFALLLAGNYRQGWLEHEWRFRVGGIASARHGDIAHWQGEVISERTLLVYAEQGLGDELRYANCIQDIIARAKHVVIECAPRLQSLFQRSFPEASVYGVKRDDVSWLSLAPSIDLQVAIGSLPLYTRTELDDYPKESGYLKADPERVMYWRERLQSLGPGLKVGISWRGGKISEECELHYADFRKDWAVVLQVPGIQFINLLYDECSEELEWARKESGVEIHDFSELDQFNDMEGVAALMSALDLLITAPTTVSEMAGALGIPTWFLVVEHFINTMGTGYVPWFPSMRCFFKDRTSQWGPVTDAIARALDELGKSSNVNTTEQPLQIQGESTETGKHGFSDSGEVSPVTAEEYYQSGLVAQQCGDLQNAKGLIQSAIDLSPENASYCYSLGDIYHMEGEPGKAIRLFREGLANDADCIGVRIKLGDIYCEQTRFDEARKIYRDALNLDEKNTESRFRLGVALAKSGHLVESVRCLSQVLVEQPDWPNIHVTLGLVSREQANFEIAEQYFQLAIESKTDDALAYNYLALTQADRQHTEQAISNYKKAIELDPALSQARFNLSLSLLAMGELIPGWQEHEWRFKAKNMDTERFTHIPLWDGSDLGEKSILVCAEQGLGDEVRYASCIGDLIIKAGHVVIECDPRLQGLYQRSFPDASVYGVKRSDTDWLSMAPSIDLQISAGSLPLYTRNRLEDFPRKDGYLKADPDKIKYWEKRLVNLGPGLKVGIAWRGGLSTVERELHYADFKKDWQSILKVPGIRFINMMYDRCDEDLEWAHTEWGIDIHDFSDLDQFNDLEGVAALMNGLDLLITPLISVSEMAGAMGVPTWVLMLSQHSIALGTDHIPWYPNSRAFFKDSGGKWGQATDDIKHALEECFNEIDKGKADTESVVTDKSEALPLEEISVLMHEAVESHQSGRFDDAEIIYRKILVYEPMMEDALHLLGLIAQEKGDFHEATRLMQKAVEANPETLLFRISLGKLFSMCGMPEKAEQCFRFATQRAPDDIEANIHLGNILLKTGSLDEAGVIYKKVLELSPDHADALNGLGVILLKKGEPERAAGYFQDVIKVKRDYTAAHNNLGQCFSGMGESDAAIQCFKEAIELEDDFADAYNNLGNAYEKKEQYKQAVPFFRQAILLNNKYPEAYSNLGICLVCLDDMMEGIRHLKEAIRLEPGYADAYTNLATAYLKTEELDAAENACLRALELKPRNPQACNNMGLVFRKKGKLDTSIKNYTEALHYDPDYEDALLNLANALTEIGKVTEAIEKYKKILELNPENISAHLNYSFALLLSGKFGHGWQEYEWRRRLMDGVDRHSEIPRWQGENPGERTLLVYAEQGVGDELRFANCITSVIELAEHVVIECDPRLQGLYKRSYPDASVFGVNREDTDWLSAAPPIDLQIALGSLPLYTRTHLEDFPAERGYLKADPIETARWKERLQSLGPDPKVGLLWRGGLRTAERDLNYADFRKYWKSILQVPGIRFINMMYDQCEDDLEWARKEWGVEIHHFSDLDQYNDLEGMAALMSSLDLLISAPTVVSEMGGALGIPVWYLIFEHHVNTLGSDHLPWFPNTRCFFKHRTKEWEPVTSEVAQELQCFSNSMQKSIN